MAIGLAGSDTITYEGSPSLQRMAQAIGYMTGYQLSVTSTLTPLTWTSHCPNATSAARTCARGLAKKMLTDEQIELCWKRWMILGAEVPTSAPDARSLHQRPEGKSRMWVRQLAKTRLTEEQRAMAQVLYPDEGVSAL